MSVFLPSILRMNARNEGVGLTPHGGQPGCHNARFIDFLGSFRHSGALSDVVSNSQLDSR
jgi:hypothetical protein